jgi:molecular chaperone GrpE
MEQDKDTEGNEQNIKKRDDGTLPDKEKTALDTVPNSPLMTMKEDAAPKPLESKEKQEEVDDKTQESESQGSDLESSKVPLDEKNMMAEEYYDRLLRTQAEFDNYRKRMERELCEFKNYAHAQLIRDLLMIIDDFQNAIAAQKNGPNEDVMKGFELIYKNLYGMLEKEGLNVIKATNEKFDPWKHEAVEMVPTTEHPDHTVIDVLQEGYMFKDRILRPAKVKVATLPKTDEDKSNDEKEKND